MAQSTGLRSRRAAMTELFKDIPGYEGCYQVSDLGRVKSLERKVNTKNGMRTIKERILKPRITKEGYYQACLYKNNKYKTFQVHRLILLTFIGFSNLECNHKNCTKIDNRLENLEYVSHLENMKHAWRNGRCKNNNGDHLKKKIDQLDLDGNYIRPFDSMMDAERALRIAQSSISRCCNGKLKTAGRYKWRFKELI